MISDKKENKIFSILKNTSDSLILEANDSKFICKTYSIDREYMNLIKQRIGLRH